MTGNGKKTLILNSGSSSLKFGLYENDKITVEGNIEEIGTKIPNFQKACEMVMKKIENHSKLIDKIVYRIVHGGSLPSPLILNGKTISKLKSLEPLAPLHMKPSLQVISFFMKKISAKHIACFDTSFHSTLPEKSRTYPIPQKIAKKYGILRYGFHGLAHASMFKKIEKITGKKYSRVISAQLGNGSSLCAIKDGKSIDTTMGFTPLEGLMMGTRSGSIDPAIVTFISNKEKIKADKVLEMLEKDSGLKAIAGTNDVRNILEKEKKGDYKSRLALDMYSHQVKKYLGSYIALLGGVDLIVLGGGIPRAPLMRKKILQGLEELGIVIDDRSIDKSASQSPLKISRGKVEVWIIETDEQKYMLDLSKKI